MSLWVIAKRVIRFCGKAFVFGMGSAVAVGGMIAAVYWYNNRPVAPTVYPSVPIVASGIKYQLTTKWQDGKIHYKFIIVPADKSLAKEFDRAANSGEQKSFTIHLGDSGNFVIPDCELDIHTLTPMVGDDGMVESLDAQGSSAMCSRSEYLTVRSFYPTYLFPAIKKESSFIPDPVPPPGFVPVPKSKKESSRGLQATITCDVIVYDREKFASGDPIAIDSLHTGDAVQLVGHVTVGDQDIIWVHGRKGYVDSCVSLKQ